MFRDCIAQVGPSLRALLVLTVLTGLLYPAAVTGLSQALFPRQADGSLLLVQETPVGSALIGQPFSDPKHFWGRPSATRPFAYNSAASCGSNRGPTSHALAQAVKARIAALRKADPENRMPVPIDLVTASGSGLDPHISPAAAAYQLGRVARTRGVDPARLAELVERFTEDRTLGFLGEPRVNVLMLNLALEHLTPSTPP